jgi:hypothetical protein
LFEQGVGHTFWAKINDQVNLAQSNLLNTRKHQKKKLPSEEKDHWKRRVKHMRHRRMIPCSSQSPETPRSHQDMAKETGHGHHARPHDVKTPWRVITTCRLPTSIPSIAAGPEDSGEQGWGARVD